MSSLMSFILKENLWEFLIALRRLVLFSVIRLMRYIHTLISPVHHLVGFEPSNSFPNQLSNLLLQQYPVPFIGLDKKSRYSVTIAFFLHNSSLNAKKQEPYKIVLAWYIYLLLYTILRNSGTSAFTSLMNQLVQAVISPQRVVLVYSYIKEWKG